MANFARARETGGTFLVRIEDIDLARAEPEHERAIFSDLAWLGLDWETPVRRQSDHLDAYRDALARLDAMGLVYPAFLSRGEVRERIVALEADGTPWPRDPDGAPLYPGPEKAMTVSMRRAAMADGRPFAWRLDMEAAVAASGHRLAWTENGFGPRGETGSIAASPSAWGDVVVGRKDAPGSYHLAVVIDDAAQRVSEIVRGRDLFHATSVHRLLQTLLGLPEPAYRHHRLVLAPDGRKMSKSRGDSGVAALRESGLDAERVLQMAGWPDFRNE